MLVLAFLAVAVAAVGTLLWVNKAQADIANTTVTLASNQGATVNPGQTITYTATVTQVGVPGGTITNARFTVNLDSANLTNVAVTSDGAGPWQTGAECTYVAPTASCVDAAGPVASDTIVITADVAPGGDNDVDPPSACFVDDGGSGQADCTSSIVAAGINGVTCTGAGTYLVGTDVTVNCTVPAGLTYCSDNDTLAARTFDADPDTGDMTVSPSSAVTAGPSAGLAPATGSDTASVTVNSAAAGNVTVSLSTHLSSSDGGPGDCEAVDTEVTFGTLADLGGGVIRHVDVDCGTERDFYAGNNHSSSGTGDYGSNVLDCNGLLSNGNIFTGNNGVTGYAQDDPDDAVGSVHTVCILSGALTDANNADIQWNITPNAPVIHMTPILKLGVDVSGNGNLEPCAQWAVGDVGVEQDITATYVPTGEVIYSNGVQALSGANAGKCPVDTSDGTIYGACQVLIKEWNSILFTKLVQDSGNRDGNDCDAPSVDSATCANADLSGEELIQSGVTNVDGFVVASDRDYVDYVLGSHADYYPGTGAPAPVDGVEQTYSQTGECGTVTIEDPSTGIDIVLDPNGAPTTLSTNSDKGVGINISPTDGNGDYNCVDGESTGVTISSRESSNFDSNDPFVTEDESITLRWVAGPGPEKQPMLAWVGQRVVLSHDWTDPATGECPWYGDPQEPEPFYVRYLIQTPSPGALSNVPNHSPAVVTGPDYIIVPVEVEDDCISHVIYESQNQGRVDVTAHVVEPPLLNLAGSVSANQVLAGSDFSVISPEYDFWYYYMKIEDATLAIVPGSRSGHNSGSFTSSGADVQEITSNVSADVLLRVKVRGWVLADNCPVKDAGADINGLLLPANRCTFPDDWAQVLGSDDQFDILGAAPVACTNVAGPFSLLNGLPPQNCDTDSVAPHVDGGFRRSVFSNFSVGSEDAPMPPALITLNLDGSGFLHGADKADIYAATNQYFVTHIPAEPQILVAGSGYQWHSWDGAGNKSGLYTFWSSLAGTGTAIESCPGATPCNDAVPTGGYDMIQIYSDNHGEAMAWVNGDANLTFDDCDFNTPVAAHGIVQLNGYYCEQGDVVGTTTVTAVADYPDKKPHRDVAANDDVTITWTWGGIKEVTVVQGSTPQFHYVVLHVTDRDGFCADSPSLHPVLGEQVDFLIDSPTGVIAPDVNGNSAEGPVSSVSANLKYATTHTFASNTADTIADGGITVEPLLEDGECQAWIHVSESQLSNVNVVITAFDPEGTVTFDTRDINPTPTPSPEPTETPVDELTWGDWNCDGSVDIGDAIVVERSIASLSNTVPAGCPAMGTVLTVTQDGLTQDRKWGDADCSGTIDIGDSINIQRAIAHLSITTFASCPGLGQVVTVPA